MAIALSFLVALFIAGYSLRGGDEVSLFFLTGVAWAAAAPLLGAALLSRPAGRHSGWACAGIGVAFFITVSVFLTRWPLRTGAFLWRSEFEALAARLVAGDPVTAPRRVGPFRILRVGIERGYACFWTDLNPGGRSGFIRGPVEPKAPFNEWSLIRLGPDWQFLIED